MKKHFSPYTLYLILLLVSFGGLQAGVYRGKEYHVDADDQSIDESRLDVLGLTLWKSTLADAQNKIVQVPIQEKHYKSGDYDSQLCYTGGGVTVLLNTEIEKERPQLLWIADITTDHSIPEKFASCAASTLVNKNMSFMGGIRLGMTQAQVKAIWGETGKTTRHVMIYQIRRKQTDYFTDDVSLYLEFKNNHLTFAEVTRTGIR